MIEVELPDGTIVEFPEGTSQDVMRKALINYQASAAAQPDAPGNQVAVSGSILPVSRMQDGSVQFDSNAGILGAIKRGVTLPGRAMRGEISVTDPQTGRVSDEAIRQSMDLAALGTPMNPATRSTGAMLPGMRPRVTKPNIAAPSADDLLTAASRQFDEMRATGARYPAQDVKRMAETAMARMNQDGFDDITAPNTFKTLQRLASPGDAPEADISGLHSARKVFGKIGQNFNNPSDQAGAAIAREALDDFIGGNGAGISGTAAAGTGVDAQRAAGALLARANANYASGKRSNLLTGIDEGAELRAAAANSGQNLGNSIRSRAASALLQPKKVAGFNDAEKQMIEELVRGSTAANVTRRAGNLIGGGQGLGGMTAAGLAGGAGALAGGPIGGAVGAAGAVAAGAGLKGLSNRLTRKALEQVDEAVRKRSPLYEDMLAATPAVPVRNIGNQNVIRALLMAQSQQSGGGGY